MTVRRYALRVPNPELHQSPRSNAFFREVAGTQGRSTAETSGRAERPYSALPVRAQLAKPNGSISFQSFGASEGLALFQSPAQGGQRACTGGGERSVASAGRANFFGGGLGC